MIAEASIRELRPEDLDDVLSIAGSLPEWFTPTGLDSIRLDLIFQHGLLAHDDGRSIGFLLFFVYEGVAHIAWMGVHPDYHRRGVGSRLVEHLLNLLRAKGFSEVRVETLGDSVEYEPYAKTRAFYRALGFYDFERVMQQNPEYPERLMLAMKIK